MESDGGPAFPVVIPASTRVDGEPKPPRVVAGGMSLRDWFAGQALAFLAHPARVGVSFDPEGDAQFAYAVADAMLAERERGS